MGKVLLGIGIGMYIMLELEIIAGPRYFEESAKTLRCKYKSNGIFSKIWKIDPITGEDLI